MTPYVFLALEIAHERTHEAERRRLATLATSDRPSRGSAARRLTARLLASVSRGSAAAVRQLDDCVADDLGRTLATK